MGLQHDLLTLFRVDKFVICPFSVAQYNPGFINPCAESLCNIFRTRIPSIDTPYNDSPIPVSRKCRIDCLVIIRFAAGPSIARPAASTGRKDEKNGSLPSISDVPDMVFIPEPSLQFRLQYHQKHSYSKDLVCLPVQEYVYDLPSHGKGG